MLRSYFKNILNFKDFLAKYKSKKPLNTASSATLVEITPKQLNELKTAVNRSTSANRNYFISFLIILLYMLIIVASTTDYQLLIPSSNVKLPIINAEVSLFIFYITAPIIVIAVHFNLLQNLEAHHHKLSAWKNAYKNNSVPRVLIDAFLYDHATLDQSSEFNKAVQFFSHILFLFLAPITLLSFLWRFADYQSLEISTWHFFLLLVDMLIVLNFNKSLNKLSKLPFTGVLIFLAGLTQITLIFIITQNYGNFIWKAEKSLRSVDIIKHDEKTNLDFKFENERDTYKKRTLSLLLPRINIDSYTSLTLSNEDLRAQAAYENISNNDLASWFMKNGKGLDLRQRNLRGANLSYADLRRVWLMHANLEGADFSHAKLIGANISNANLEGADFSHANLESSKLNGTNLKNASLNSANLKNAKLLSAKLPNARLDGVKLLGASLLAANLNGSSLQYAQVQGAVFYDAKLQRTDFSYANLQGASFVKANLQGSNIVGASAQGANFIEANLQGSNLFETKIRGAIFSSKPAITIYSLKNLDIETKFSSKEIRILYESFEDKNKVEDIIKSSEIGYPFSHVKKAFVEDKNILIKHLPSICKTGFYRTREILSTIFKEDQKILKAMSNIRECRPFISKIEAFLNKS